MLFPWNLILMNKQRLLHAQDSFRFLKNELLIKTSLNLSCPNVIFHFLTLSKPMKKKLRRSQ